MSYHLEENAKAKIGERLMGQQRYIIQGLDENVSFLQEIEALFLNGNFSDIWFLTAYLKSDAIYNLSTEIRKSKAKVHFIVGIGNGVTSYQALKELLKLRVELYTVDTAKIGSIFHVKEVLALGNNLACIICGSANITPGGLSRNIEAGVVSTFDLTKEEDNTAFQQAMNIVNALITSYPEHIKKRSIDDIDKLFEYGRVEDENRITTSTATKATSKHSITAKPFPLRTVKLKTRKKDVLKKAITTIKDDSNNISVIEYKQVWQSRPLSKSNIGVTDNPNTHAKGEMGLGKGKWTGNFNPQQYFRDEVFGDLEWHQNDLGDTVAEGIFKLHICGTDHGNFKLTLLHKRKGMEAENQNNYLTSVRWGDASEFVRNKNLIGRTLRLYKSIDGTHFLIDID